MKVFICSISIFCLSYINAQKPPLKASINCKAVVGIYEEDLTDKDGVSLKYSENTCDVHYKGKPYTGKVKTCKNNKIFGITNYVNGRLLGERYDYFENGNLNSYVVFGKDTTNGEGSLLTDEEMTIKNNRLTFRDIVECNGVTNGEEIVYNYDGGVDRKGINVNGNREGKWYFYDIKGAVMEVRTYKAGILISCSGKCQ
jgi:antitoxin component YwqK of YwqJK toxin-antitoxin module